MCVGESQFLMGECHRIAGAYDLSDNRNEICSGKHQRRFEAKYLGYYNAAGGKYFAEEVLKLLNMPHTYIIFGVGKSDIYH